MFRLARMAKIDLQVPQDHVAKTTSIIANLKILHLMNIRKTRVGEMDLESHTDSNLLSKYIELKGRLERIFLWLEINPDDLSLISKEEVNPHKDIIVIDQEIQKLEKEISGLVKDVEAQEKTRKEKEQLLRQLELLASAGVDTNQIHECRFLYVAAGLIPAENMDRLEFSLSDVYHLLLPSNPIGSRRLVFAFGSRKDREKIEKALKSAYFEKIEIPRQDENSRVPSIQSLRGQIQELEMQKSIARKNLEKVKKELEERLKEVNRKVLLSVAILEIGKSYDKVGRVYHISGWVPQDVVPVLEKKVQEATKHQVRIAVLSSNVMWQVGDLLKIPTCFQNPFLLKPFEKLVSEYGIPSYKEVDPTFFFALSFLFMFGVMFGDVGHGLALILMGLFTFKKSSKQNLQDIGLIIMECGIMSTIFGFLYGSVFGFEHLIPPLWFNPMENIYYFMKVTVGFGMIIISIALILNIINSIKHSDYERGIFGEFGIMGLVFYWGCVGLVLFYLTTGKFLDNFGYLFMILFLPLLAIFLKEPLYNLYNRVVFKKKIPILPKNLGIYLMESLIEVGDTVIGFLSNTVSFIRVSAFALAHAGLFLAVFALANVLQGLKGGIFWYWLIMLVGNIGIIAIEGLVVSIQIIRLEYYEFFSKFFKGGGEIYKPLRI
ncbi:MAG: V-type ATPase 116kDa subunit family protein [bacterium]